MIFNLQANNLDSDQTVTMKQYGLGHSDFLLITPSRWQSKMLLTIDERQSGLLLITPSRWQSKTLFTIDERGSKTARNGVFDCHLSQMAIQNSVFNDFGHYFLR